MRILVNNVAANALIDTGSTLSYVNEKFAIANKLKGSNENNEIGLAVTGNCFQSKEVCLSTIRLQNRTYSDIKLHVLKHLLTDVIVGQDILYTVRVRFIINFDLILVVQDLRCVLMR